jgi:hypothetical protein
MEATSCDDQVEAVADRLNGDPTSALSAGLLTVTPASAGIDSVMTSEHTNESFVMVFIGFLCE